MLLVQQYAHQMGQALMCYLHTKYRTFKQIDALGKPEERRTVLVPRQQSTGLSTVFFYVTCLRISHGYPAFPPLGSVVLVLCEPSVAAFSLFCTRRSGGCRSGTFNMNNRRIVLDNGVCGLCVADDGCFGSSIANYRCFGSSIARSPLRRRSVTTPPIQHDDALRSLAT